MLVEPLLVMPVALPLARIKTEKAPLVQVMSAFAMLWQMYVLLSWCVVVLFFTVAVAMRPDVQHRWVYHVFGFFGCLAPIQAMASYDRHPDQATTLKQAIATAVVAAAFIAFQFAPRLMMPWSWLMHFLSQRYS